jgi:hypothetical protein
VSLREAIQAINNGSAGADTDISNQNPGVFGVNDTINFNISASGTVQTINVGGTGNGALPTLSKPMTINGYSEPGASMNTQANSDNAKILIELNGANAGPNADGLLVNAAVSTIQGLAINRFSLNGIELQGGGDTLAGNFVGTNPAGNAAEPNQNDGIHIITSSNTIGGTTPGARNIVSGNQIDGIHVDGTTGSLAASNLIEGNFVGVNAAGTGAVGIKAIGGGAGTPAGNFVFGIEISGGMANTVGGATAGARNVVGFNAAGIEVDDGGQNNVIQGNFAGVGADGVTPVGNNLHGIVLRSDDNLSPPLGPGQANEPAVSGNIIGLNPNTNFSGLGNLVEFNGTGGIAVFGNPLPNNATPIQNSGNSILGNSVFENGRSSTTTPLLGIDLTNGFVFPKDDAFTANDSKGHGVANDPNNFQNFPILTAVAPVSGGIQITGSLTQSVSPNTQFRIEFFANNPDPLGLPAEGQTFLGAITVTTNASGTVSFSPTFNVSVQPGQIITATATNLTADPSAQAGAVNVFNTSEFSPGVTFAPTTPPPFVSVAFGPAGEVLLVTRADGTLIRIDASGAHSGQRRPFRQRGVWSGGGGGRDRSPGRPPGAVRCDGGSHAGRGRDLGQSGVWSIRGGAAGDAPERLADPDRCQRHAHPGEQRHWLSERGHWSGRGSDRGDLAEWQRGPGRRGRRSHAGQRGSHRRRFVPGGRRDTRRDLLGRLAGSVRRDGATRAGQCLVVRLPGGSDVEPRDTAASALRRGAPHSIASGGKPATGKRRRRTGK